MRERLMDLGLLWLRVLAGLGLMVHGWYKVTGGVANFAAHGVDPLGFPMPIVFAWAATAAELVGGFFLILGLWTRYAAAALTFNMAVAAFGTGFAGLWIAPGQPRTKELALAYLVMVVTLLCTGPGRFAVDSGRSGGRPAPKKKGKR
jgi:putative oxidoreductase